MQSILKNKFSVILVVFSISLVQGLQQCVSPVLNQISSQYSTVDLSLIQMLVTAPVIAAVVSSLCSSAMVANIGKKKLLLIAALVAGVVGLLPLLSDSFLVLFVSRVLYGFSMGVCMALNAAVVADHFEGKERTLAMGIQSACVGTGMLLVTSIAGALGANHYKNAFFVNLLAFVSFGIIALCLPDKGKEKTEKTKSEKINGTVWGLAFFGCLQSVFVMTFVTNISLHISGPYAADPRISGLVIGAFSVAQIVIGLLLGKVSEVMNVYTLPFGVFAFVPGAIILLLFSDNLPLLMIGALFCGITQGIFMPQASTEVTNAVGPSAITMAAAILSCAVCGGQLASPVISNGLVKIFFGEVTTSGVYTIAAAAMLLVGIALALWETHIKKEKAKAQK